MRTIIFLIKKEFLQIFRDKFIGKAIFGIPIIQMLILVPAITFEIKSAKLCIIDNDMTSESRGLISKLDGSPFFSISQATSSEKEANDLLYGNKADVVLHIPSEFGRNLGLGKPAKVMASVNAINAMTAQLSWAYLSGVIRDYNLDLVLSGNPAAAAMMASPATTYRYWYNEMLNYKHYMLPGILVILVTAIGFVLAGLNMVKEKEIGTIEQINVTPVKKYQFVTAKMIPFLLIGLIDLALGLGVGKLLFHIPFEGSLFLLFICSAIFLVAALGMALFVSTMSGTQQQFMFVTFFFMIIFILMSGIFTPMESMPAWAQKIDLLNPVAYLMRINRMIMLKGSAFADISRDIYALAAIAVVFTALAINRYRKTA